MADSILSRFTPRTSEQDVSGTGESDGSDDLGSFGLLRGPRERCVMLELRKKDGTILAIGYGWIERMEFDATTITLHAGAMQILIRGRNLNAEARPQTRLFQSLTKHKVSFVQEADHATVMRAGNRDVVIESLQW